MKNQSLLQYLVSGTAWALFGRIITVVAGFLLSTILARMLTPSNMATFFIANSIAIFLALTGRFGLDNTILRIVSESISISDYSRVKNILIRGLILVSAISLTLSCIVYFGPGELILSLIFPGKKINLVVGFISIWLITISFQFLLGEIFRSLKEINIAVILGGALTAILNVIILLTLFLYKEHADIYEVLIIMIASGLINLTVGLIILFLRLKEFDHDAASTNQIRLHELFLTSWPLWLNSITHYIFSYSGLWILGSFKGNKDVAYYGAANRLVTTIGISLVIVNSVIPPLIAGLAYIEKKEKIERIMRGSATIASIPAILIAIALFLYAKQSMHIFFGPLYGDGAYILQILLIGQLVSVLCGSCGYLLMMTGNQKVIMSISVLFSTISVSAGIFIVNLYGVIGVSLVTTCTIIAQQIITVFCAYKITGVLSIVSVRKTLQFIRKDIINYRYTDINE